MPANRMPKHGSLDERTVRVSYNSMRDRYYVTTSIDGHRITAVPVFDYPHEAECLEIATAYESMGYTRLADTLLATPTH